MRNSRGLKKCHSEHEVRGISNGDPSDFVLRMTLFLMLTPNAWGATQEITFQEAITSALEKNLDIKIAELDLELGEAAVKAAKSVFDTTLTSEIDWEKNKDKPSSTLSPTSTTTQHYNLGLTKKTALGTNFDLDFINIHKSTNSTVSTTRQYWDPVLSLSITQPLLKNFFGFSDRKNLASAHYKNLKLTQESKDGVETALLMVSNSYWELSAAQTDMEIKKKARDQANKLYEANLKKIKLGTIEETDLWASESNLKARENDLLAAQNRWENKHRAFKLSLQNETAETVSAKDSIVYKAENFSVAATLTKSLNQRKDYLAAQENLKMKNVEVQMRKNELLPQIDLVSTLSTNGLDPKYQRAVSDMQSLDYPIYFIGIEVKAPLENRGARSQFETSRAEKMEAVYTLKKLQNQIHLEVTEKIKTLESLQIQVKTAQKIVELDKQKMTAEEKKFNQGRSSINFVIQYQEDFLNSSSRYNETLLTYQKALLDLKKTQGSLYEHLVGEHLVNKSI